MNRITQKELLEFCYEDAKRIIESQYLEIDEQYNLLDVEGITEPLITINELRENLIVINIKYNRLDSFGNPVGDIELNLCKPKSIIKDGEIYNFDKIVK